MKDEDPVQSLHQKVNVLTENMNLVQQFFLEKSAQNDQKKQLIDEEQKTINEILRRWKVMEEEVSSMMRTPPPRSQSGSGYVNSNGPNAATISSSPSPSPSPQYNWREKHVSRPTNVYIPFGAVGGSSPGRSPKSRESQSHTSYRRQNSLTPSKNSQYPVLPKKRKIQQLVFSPTVSSASSSSAHTEYQQSNSVPEEMVFNVDPGSVNMDSTASTPEEVQDSQPAIGSTEYQQNLCTSSGENSDMSPRKENLVINYTDEMEAEDLTHKPLPKGDFAPPVVTLITVPVRTPDSASKPENEAESRPPKLSPATGRNANHSPSSRRTPFPLQSQGSRKSARTPRPSWKLNNSSDSLSLVPGSSPERVVRDEKRDRDRSTSSTSTPNAKKRKRPTSRVRVPDEPPVLTNQMEVPVPVKLEDDAKDDKSWMPGSGNKNLECPKCSKVFATQHGLRYHIESHMQLKPFKCTICSKCFGQKSTLTRHEATTHTKVKDHICGICKKTFSSQSELKSHMGRHEAKRNSCPVCNRGFIDKRYFKLHVKLCTAKNVEEDANGDAEQGGSRMHSLFQCSNCLKNYRDPNYFKKHVSLCMKE